MRDVVSYTDHFVICSGRNPRQAQAIADQIAEALKRDRLMARRVEGNRQGDWILLDYLDVVVHVFTPEARSFYPLSATPGNAGDANETDGVAALRLSPGRR